MSSSRPPAVAGLFYPSGRAELSADVRDLLAAVPLDTGARPPKALIVPHAGYVYSGPVAASGYARLAPLAGRIRRVVLLGPVHRVPVRGLALPGATTFSTPLGEVPLDTAAITALADLPQVTVSTAAHAQEHSLEVHLPFLQTVLGEFHLLPLAVGDATPGEVAEVNAMPGVDLKPEGVGAAGPIDQRLQTISLLCPARGAIAATVQLDQRRANRGTGFQLIWVGIDEQADPDAGFPQCVNRSLQGSVGVGDIESALGGDFLAILRHQADEGRFHLQRDVENFEGVAHFEIHLGVDLFAQFEDVGVLDVPPVLAQVYRD